MTRIGWIGLGHMGLPMCLRLISGGHTVSVFNRTAAKTVPAVDAGASIADTPAEVSAQSNIVFTMVADADALSDVLTGSDGILASLQPGHILVDMSTISAEQSASFNTLITAKGCRYLRAPVTGSTVFAASGKLGVLCSGDRSAYDEVLPLFELMSVKQYYLGSQEEARTMKLAMNMMVGMTAQMLAESLTFGSRAGLDWQQMLSVFSDSVIASPLVKYKAESLKARSFDAAFSVKLMEKDFNLALSAAQEKNIPLPMTALTKQLLTSARANGRGDQDFSVLVLVMEELAGILKDDNKWEKTS